MKEKLYDVAYEAGDNGSIGTIDEVKDYIVACIKATWLMAEGVCRTDKEIDKELEENLKVVKVVGEIDTDDSLDEIERAYKDAYIKCYSEDYEDVLGIKYSKNAMDIISDMTSSLAHEYNLIKISDFDNPEEYEKYWG